jgi:ribosomal protein S4E
MKTAPMQHKKTTWIDKTTPVQHKDDTWINKTAPVQHKKDSLDRQNSTSAA